MAKLKQIVWFDQETMIQILQIAKETGLAENQVIATIVSESLKNEEFIKNLLLKLQEHKPKGIIYRCTICDKTFNFQNDLIKHLYTHAQPKQQ